MFVPFSSFPFGRSGIISYMCFCLVHVGNCGSEHFPLPVPLFIMVSSTGQPQIYPISAGSFWWNHQVLLVKLLLFLDKLPFLLVKPPFSLVSSVSSTWNPVRPLPFPCPAGTTSAAPESAAFDALAGRRSANSTLWLGSRRFIGCQSKILFFF